MCVSMWKKNIRYKSSGELMVHNAVEKFYYKPYIKWTKEENIFFFFYIFLHLRCR